MTDNQFDQLFNIMTKCVGGIQELQKDVAEIKTDVAELKKGQINLEAGQARIENEMHKNNKSLLIFNQDLHDLRVRVGIIEDRLDVQQQSAV